MKWIVVACALALPVMGVDKPRQLIPKPEPVPATNWNAFPQIPQRTLICFVQTPNDPYLNITQGQFVPHQYFITPHPTEGYYQVDYLGPSDEIAMTVRYPASQCIYREAGGMIP